MKPAPFELPQMKIWRGSIGYFSLAHSITRLEMGPSSSIVQPKPARNRSRNGQ